ncbi:MAG: hypothetical protein ACJ73S_17385 [Mycobacteriales bacterium]
MTDLDQLIRQSFADEAAEAPDGADLLHRVRHRNRQLTVRRRLTAAGIAVAVTGAAVPAALLAAHAAHHGGAVTTPTPDSTKPPTLRLAPAHVVVPDMPVYAGWLPATPVGTYVTAYADLIYEFGGSAPAIEISLSPQDPLASPALSNDNFVHEPTTVGGAPATFTHTTGDGQPLSLSWQRTPGQWVSVAWSPRFQEDAARASTDRTTLTRVAENLHDQHTPVTTPFRFRWLPERAAPALVDPDQMYFRLHTSGNLIVDVQAGRPIPVGLSPATAGRWHGWVGLRDTGDAMAGLDRWHTAFYVQLDPDHTLMISGSRTELDQLDILGIAQGLTLRGR